MHKLIRRRKRAQGMTEYIIIVGLIAILLIAAVKLFGQTVDTAFKQSTSKIQTEVINNGINGGGGGNPAPGGG